MPSVVKTPETIRVGLLGAARITPRAVIRPARRLPEVVVAAVAARDPDRAGLFARRHGIPRVHPTYDALVQDPELDAVYIALPNSLHAEWSIRALEAGKHVLCEKPLASNAAEADQAAGVASRTGRVLAEAMHYRYHPLAARLKAIVNGGELGAIRRLEADFCVPLWLPGKIRYRYELGGGATMDLGCYTINLLRYLVSAEPEVVKAEARLASPQVDRFMRAELWFPDKAVGEFTCSLCSSLLLRVRARVEGTEGELRVTNPFRPDRYHRLVVRGRTGVRREHVEGDTTFFHQLQAFAQAVRGEGPMATDARDAVANLRVIDAVYEKAGLRRRG